MNLLYYMTPHTSNSHPVFHDPDVINALNPVDENEYANVVELNVFNTPGLSLKLDG